MSKKEYLRGRPFLTVEVTQRPAANVNTKVKGWMDQPGAMQSFEKVSFLDRINNETKFNVIIDILNSVCVRNTSAISDNEILATYLSNYKDKVIQAMTVWAQKEAKQLAEADRSDRFVTQDGTGITVDNSGRTGEGLFSAFEAPCNGEQCEQCQDDPTCHKEVGNE